MPKVSVIVPMYNVEKYLPKCIESIINQSLKDIEIILIDDESPDNCGKMADEYAKNDKRIKVVHQKNKWLGGARNTGIKNSTGEYITCVDSDDFLDEKYCEELYNFAENNKCECVYHLSRLFDDKNGIIKDVERNLLFKAKNPLDREDIVSKVFPLIISSYDINVSSLLLSRSIIEKGFLFDEDIRYAEDYDAALKLYKIASSVGYCNKAIYYYRQNDQSIMHIVKYERLFQIIHLYKIREEFIKENNLETKENLYNSANLLINRIIKSFPEIFGKNNKNTYESRKQLKELFKNKHFQEALSRLNIKNFEMGLFGKLCFLSLKLRLPGIIIVLSKKYSDNI